MNQLLLQPTPLSQWYSLVSEAHAQAPVQLDQHSESYLVYMLMRFTDKPQAMQSILALDFLHCAHLHGAEREQHLREVGDKCLLLAGLFPERAERRCLRISYFVDLGRTAYDAMATPEYSRASDVSQKNASLSAAFVPMMDVLHTLRTFSQDHPFQLNRAQAEALWTETGSRFALQQLQAPHK